ncbi:MAG: hypothetical protein HGA96_02560 [Desulfobulbaceae bacterium]|nr:hypothetical protein [Desulfobulbaceae bacterium]
MPTWKLIDGDDQSHFQYLCGECSQRKEAVLKASGWQLIRPGEPVSCRDCTLKCRLTAEGLWGAEDAIRYALCEQCPELAACELKGRYFC